MWNIPQNNYTKYLQACEEACSFGFDTFKQDPNYTNILEHVNPVQGMEYYSYIPDGRFLEQFKENDIYGSPTLIDTPLGKISPTTLRYTKQALEIKDLFNYRSIVEVGGGYGGLCKTLHVLGWKTYSIVDLEQPIKLTEKYLDKFKIKTDLYTPVPVLKADLFISNYAFSECNGDLQEEYFDKIIKNCNQVYITHNTTYSQDYPVFMDRCKKIFKIQEQMEPISNTNSMILCMYK